MSRQRTTGVVVLAAVAGLAVPAGACGQVVVTSPGPVVVGRPVVVQGYDAYQDALGRLRSRHANSRRDGAVTLGRYRDPRAVPDLVWLLQNDRDPEVRSAAAFALGAIGDPRAANALRAVAMTDNNRRVRQVAAHAHGQLTYAVPAATVTTVGPAPEVVVTQPAVVVPGAVTAWPPATIPLEAVPAVELPR